MDFRPETTLHDPNGDKTGDNLKTKSQVTKAVSGTQSRFEPAPPVLGDNYILYARLLIGVGRSVRTCAMVVVQGGALSRKPMLSQQINPQG